MRYFLISDNHDTLVGLRLAGIEGVLVHDREAVTAALDRAALDPEIGIVLITEKLAGLAGAELDERKKSRPKPLILEIPDRHGTRRAADSM